MVTRFKHWRRYDADVAGVGLFALVALVGYALVVHRPLADSLGYDQTLQQREETAAGVASLRAQCVSIKDQIDQANRRLTSAELDGRGSHTVDELISRLHAVGSQCGVVLTRLQPTTGTKEPGFQVTRFLVEGRASFPAIHRWFALIESSMPYLDVTHFAVRGSNDKDTQGATLCLFECSLKFYVVDSDKPSTAPVKQP